MGKYAGSIVSLLISLQCIFFLILTGDSIYYACTMITLCSNMICAAIESLKDNKKSPN